MKNSDYKKILKDDFMENILVHVVLCDYNKEEYECIGVLIKEDTDTIRVAFNAKEDNVIDYLDIKKINIVNIDIIDNLSIKEI